MADYSRARQMGREAGLAGSHRKPPKGASEAWQEAYWQAWREARDDARQAYQALQRTNAGMMGVQEIEVN